MINMSLANYSFLLTANSESFSIIIHCNHHVRHWWHIVLLRPCRGHISVYTTKYMWWNASQATSASGLSDRITMHLGGCFYLYVNARCKQGLCWSAKTVPTLDSTTPAHKIKNRRIPSIHLLSAYPGSGRGGSSLSREAQTSLSPATTSSSSWGIPRRSQASQET